MAEPAHPFRLQEPGAREHDAWFRAEVEQGMRDADDPAVKRIAHDEVAARWRRQRAALVKQAADRTT